MDTSPKTEAEALHDMKVQAAVTGMAAALRTHRKHITMQQFAHAINVRPELEGELPEIDGIRHGMFFFSLSCDIEGQKAHRVLVHGDCMLISAKDPVEAREFATKGLLDSWRMAQEGYAEIDHLVVGEVQLDPADDLAWTRHRKAQRAKWELKLDLDPFPALDVRALARKWGRLFDGVDLSIRKDRAQFIAEARKRGFLYDGVKLVTREERAQFIADMIVDRHDRRLDEARSSYPRLRSGGRDPRTRSLPVELVSYARFLAAEEAGNAKVLEGRDRTRKRLREIAESAADQDYVKLLSLLPALSSDPIPKQPALRGPHPLLTLSLVHSGVDIPALRVRLNAGLSPTPVQLEQLKALGQPAGKRGGGPNKSRRADFLAALATWYRFETGRRGYRDNAGFKGALYQFCKDALIVCGDPRTETEMDAELKGEVQRAAKKARDRLRARDKPQS